LTTLIHTAKAAAVVLRTPPSCAAPVILQKGSGRMCEQNLK
jgi:hypothetical protein